MLSLSSSIHEIDSLIKNMEMLAPSYTERLKILKHVELKALMKNEDLLSLIRDISGDDWQEETASILKKLENRYKIQQFTDIYINSLRCFLIFKILEEQTSSSDVELAKDYGQWIFNAQYDGSKKKVVWFDVKLSKYFPMTDLPKKFMHLMNGEQTFTITKEWLFENQSFFSKNDLSKTFDQLLEDFIVKLAKEEKLPELDLANDLPQEREYEPSVMIVEKTELKEAIEQKVAAEKQPATHQVMHQNQGVKKRMIQVGVDIAGDPIMEEEGANVTVSEKEIFVEKVEKAISSNYDPLTEILNTEIQIEQDIPLWESNSTKTVDINKNPTTAIVKPVFSKPGSFKPGSKPGSKGVGVIISDSYDDDRIVYVENVLDSDRAENSNPITSNRDNEIISDLNISQNNSIFVSENDEAESFEELLDKKAEEEKFYAPEEVLDLSEVGEQLFSNGMTNNAQKEQEMQKIKEQGILKLEADIKKKEETEKTKLKNSVLANNNIFMSIKKQEDKNLQ